MGDPFSRPRECVFRIRGTGQPIDNGSVIHIKMQLTGVIMECNPRRVVLRVNRFVLVFVFLFLAGCAANPTPEELARRKQLRLEEQNRAAEQRRMSREAAQQASFEWLTKRSLKITTSIQDYVLDVASPESEVLQLLGPPDRRIGRTWQYEIVDNGSNFLLEIRFTPDGRVTENCMNSKSNGLFFCTERMANGTKSQRSGVKRGP